MRSIPWHLAPFFAVQLCACGSSTPPEGAVGGACYPNGTCNAGLACFSNLCVDANVDAGADAAPEASGGDGGQVLDAAADADACVPPGPPLVVFLNRGGGAYKPGTDNSTTNTVSFLSQSTTVPAWGIDDPTWTTLLTCVATKFSPFDVNVTDVDPGTAAHVEIVFVPDGDVPNGADALASLHCNGVSNAVDFVPTTYASNPDNGCAAAASSVGINLGLDHVIGCTDAMAWDQASCATAPFTDTTQSCGTTDAGACVCGGTTQNSFQRIVSLVGPACQ